MEMLKISFAWHKEYNKDARYLKCSITLLEIITQETPFKFATSMSIEGRPLWNLQSTNDIDLLRSNEREQQLIERLERTAERYGMEIR